MKTEEQLTSGSSGVNTETGKSIMYGSIILICPFPVNGTCPTWSEKTKMVTATVGTLMDQEAPREASNYSLSSVCLTVITVIQ